MSNEKFRQIPNILIVDDIEINIILLVEILKGLDVNLIQAMSGQEALEKIKDKEIALALIDIHLPQMDGAELASIIQNDESREKIPIIFITAYPNDEIELEQYYLSGAVDFVQKPFRKKILLSKVAVFLELYRQKQQIREQKLHIEQRINHLEELNKSLNKRLAYERLLSRISEMVVSEFDIEDFITPVLLVIGETLGLCRSCIFKYNKQTDTMDIAQEWCSKDVNSLKKKLQKVDCSKIQFWMETLKKGEIHNYSDINDIPDKSVRKLLCPKNVLSILAIPLFMGDKFDGFMGFNDCGKQREWTEQDVEFLWSISRIIVSVTERKQIEEKLKQTRLLLRSSLESPKDIVIVSIDKNYGHLYFNEAHKLTMKNAYNMEVEIGMNILECITVKKDRNNAKKNFDMALSGKSIVTTQKFGGINKAIYENSYNPIKNDKNEVVGVTLFARDITQRIQAEEELKDSLEQLHQLSKYVDKVREEERITIARELHDDLGQALTAVKIDLGIIRQAVHDDELKRRISKTHALVGDTIKTVQRITFQLRPKIIDDLGLLAGIEWYTSEFSERNEIEINLDLDEEINVSPDISIVIFRIMQESLTNVVRHSRATQVTIQLYKKDNSCNFILSDNGVGISDIQLLSKTSFGIIGMRERAKSVGGMLDICKLNSGGTSLKLMFSLHNLENLKST